MSVDDVLNRSTEEWEAVLGVQIRNLRLRQGLSQEHLAKLASISLAALKKLEQGKGVNLVTLIKAVRSLGRTDWLESLAPAISISPMDMLKSARKGPRQRAPRRISTRRV